MVSAGYELGSGALTSLRVWCGAIALTFAFCEGAGFGAFSYHCMWYDPFAAPVPQCTLAAQALLPPAVSWTAFAWNAASLWIAGFLNGGFLVGTLLAVFALVIASRMSSAAVVRVFSFVPIAAVATILCILAYHSEVRATIAAAFPQ